MESEELRKPSTFWASSALKLLSTRAGRTTGKDAPELKKMLMKKSPITIRFPPKSFNQRQTSRFNRSQKTVNLGRMKTADGAAENEPYPNFRGSVSPIPLEEIRRNESLSHSLGGLTRLVSKTERKTGEISFEDRLRSILIVFPAEGDVKNEYGDSIPETQSDPDFLSHYYDETREECQPSWNKCFRSCPTSPFDDFPFSVGGDEVHFDLLDSLYNQVNEIDNILTGSELLKGN